MVDYRELTKISDTDDVNTQAATIRAFTPQIIPDSDVLQIIRLSTKHSWQAVSQQLRKRQTGEDIADLVARLEDTLIEKSKYMKAEEKKKEQELARLHKQKEIEQEEQKNIAASKIAEEKKQSEEKAKLATEE